MNTITMRPRDDVHPVAGAQPPPTPLARPTVNDVLDLYGKEYLPFQAATTRYQKSRVIPFIRSSLVLQRDFPNAR